MNENRQLVEHARIEWLEDPQVFCVNRLKAHSDHVYFQSKEEWQQGGMELRQSLNGVWKFSYAENPSLRQADFYKEEYDISEFDEIQVPGHIQLGGYDRCHYVNTMYPWDGHKELRPPHIDWDYNPVGSYVKEFDLSEALEGKQVLLSLQGVETACYVWLNGQFIGYGEDSFTPSEYDLTPWMKKKGNRLAIEVYKRSSASWLEDQDFFRFSGIFREVYLYGIPETHIRDLQIIADFEPENQSGHLKAAVEMDGILENCFAKAVLTDAEGAVICHFESVPCARHMVFEEVLSQVCPWNGEDPYRYTLVITISRQHEEKLGSHIVEIVPQRVGFRRFEIKNRIMCLNGKRLVFNGINRHEFHMSRGRCVTEEDMLWDIKFMKQNNINAVRTCHYPNASLWYELCDEYGIYLMDEANLESHGSWQKMGVCEPSWNVPGSLPEWREAVLDRAESMVERDKNHPSILIWSCGNESYAGENILAMSEYFRQKDPTRLVHYEGVFWNREFDAASDMESRMYAKPSEVEAYLNNHPQKPYILCEYMHAMGNSLGGMKKYTDLAEHYPLYQGGFIWDYIDQTIGVRQEDGTLSLRYGGDFGDRPTDYQFCGNGVVYGDRTPSPKVQEMKYRYQFLEIKPEQGKVNIRNKKLFTDTRMYRFIFQIRKNGELIWSKDFEVNIKPMEEHTVPVDTPALEEGGEYVYHVLAVLKEKTAWADAGAEIAFGESVVKIKEQQPKQNMHSSMTVIHGDVNVGVKGEDFFVLFSRTEGGIVSLCHKGIEWITRAPVPIFWRATTENDRGNKFSVTSGVWMGAGAFLQYSSRDVEITETNEEICVRYTYGLIVVPETIVEVTYRVTPDGKIGVKAHYFGKPGLPELPLFGMGFRFLNTADVCSYYGKGPEENYCDRADGARLSIYHGTPKTNMSRYLVPQECGNRTGVRWLTVKDQRGSTIKFTAVETPFEMSVLPYTPGELETALHMEELPNSPYTIVNILAKQRGVGGDDSWGAPVHPEYCISGDKDIEFAFEMCFI